MSYAGCGVPVLEGQRERERERERDWRNDTYTVVNNVSYAGCGVPVLEGHRQRERERERERGKKKRERGIPLILLLFMSPMQVVGSQSLRATDRERKGQRERKREREKERQTE